MWLIFCISIAFSQPKDAVFIDEGDLLWGQKKYSQATKKWKKAAKSDTTAIKAMAEYRLMLTASNVGLALHGIRGDTALNQCTLDDPWCLLARVDRDIIFKTLGFPIDISLCEQLLQFTQQSLPERSAARKVALGLKNPNDLSFAKTDAFGKSIISQGGQWDRGPGGDIWGISFYGGGRLGTGIIASYLTPNVDKKLGQLYILASIGTQKFGNLSVRYTSHGKIWWQTAGDIRRVTYFKREGNDWQAKAISSAFVNIFPGLQVGNFRLWAGPQLRWDRFESPTAAHGLTSGFRWSPLKRLNFTQSFEFGKTDYLHLRSTSQFVGIHRSGFAAYMVADICPSVETPWWRWPTAGGDRYLRLPFAQWFRGAQLYTITAEWRLFQQNPLGFVVFSEGGYVAKDTYYGGGIGTRLRLIPGEANTIRFDIGYGTTGFGLSFGVGEFF